MKNQGKRKLLGSKLIEAGVISEGQLKVALEDQRHYNLRLGEILVQHNWLKQRTADFFAQEWEIAKATYPRQPIGYYLQRAALLNEGQIRYILDEQEKQHKRRFGEIAVQQAWLKSETIRFFLEGLNENMGILNDLENSPVTTLRKAILHINEPHIVIVEEGTVICELHDVEREFNSKVRQLSTSGLGQSLKKGYKH